ncbi:hypothetical protein PF007_g4551 [Phytophthora fragariae]|uniref:Uncharacterized protein n=1 Tax=Phytophthora fragariae TaxID=53985 RepID=A0A6A3T5M6_9STRA|nr:hypothetical protein PF007_g4551 [Phytophthora fragariae]
MAAEVKAEKPDLTLKWLKRLTADLDDDEDSSDATPQSTPQKPTRTREGAPALQAEASGEEGQATSKKEEPPQQKEEDGGRVGGNANKSNHVEKKVRRKRHREEEKDVDAVKPSHKKIKGGKRQLVVVAGTKRRNSGVEIADGQRGHRQRQLDKGEVAERSRPRGSPLPTRDVHNALSETQELSVDSAKSKAADFRQQRMRKLHARRLATGEHDRLSAVKLKREAKKGKQKRGEVVKMPTVVNKEKEERGEKMSTVEREEKVATLEMEKKKEREEKVASVEKAEKMATQKKEKMSSAEKAEKMGTLEKEKMAMVEKKVKMATVEKEEKMATVKKEKMATGERPEKMASVEQEEKMATGGKPEKMATVEKPEKMAMVEKKVKMATVEKEEKIATVEMEEKEETQKMETVEKEEKEDMLKIEKMENVEKEEKVVDHASALRAAGFKDVAVSDEPVEGKHKPSPPPLSRSDAADSTVDHDPDLEAVSETGNKAGEIESKVEETTKQDILLDMMPIPRKSSAEKFEAAPSAVEFVIPKRSVKTSVGSTESILGVKAMRAGSLGDGKTLSSSIPVTIKPVPSPSPKPSPTFSRRPPVQIQRKRTKNHVPVKKSTVAPQDRALMRLARKRNSIFVAAAELAAPGHSDTSAKKAPVRMTGYEVFDIDGKTLPDLIPRLSCPTKREMASNRDAYPAVFFGVCLSVPKAKGGSSPAPDDSESGKCDERRMSCYEELRFERPEDREFYQQRMYGTTFVPQRLRGWTTLIVRNARFERKSTGIRFNQDRDRDEFAAMLSKRYTFKKSVPRCDIPRENWQKLMRNQPGAVYLHYYNREDAEQASLFFHDELGNPLELRLEYRAGVVINRSSTPATRSVSQNRSRRSGSAEQFAPESSPLSSQGGSARSTPSWRRERQRTPRGDYRQSVLKGSVVSTLPRDQEIIEGGKGLEEGELGNSTTTDTIATDRREKIQRSRSPPQRQHVRNMQAPQQHRESYPAGLHERSRGNRGFDRKRSRSRSRPRGSRGEYWGTKEGRRPRNFSPGDRSNTGPRRPVYPDDMNRYGGRGYQKEGHRGRMGGSNSRPH